jgi:HD-GYP domain-containing protein (c-di-GMP phosphodiesterase class II)
MACRLGVDPAAAAMIRYHHVWYGGTETSRYPDRSIPLGAGVLAVADAFVTMTSHRPYRDALSASATVAELRRARGTQFDPRIIDALPRALLAEVPLDATLEPQRGSHAAP